MEKSPIIFGIFLQSSMILALGAQNLFVLEKGLLRDRPILIATICSLCDVSLILFGVLGAGSFFAKNAILSLGLKFAGAAFLFKYAFDKFQETRTVSESRTDLILQKSSVTTIILSALAVSLLNPHVYLDTVVLIGSYSTKYPVLEDKLGFAMGASLFSIAWFFSLSFGASFFSSALSRPRIMKFINYAASLIMSYLGVNLLLSF